MAALTNAPRIFELACALRASKQGIGALYNLLIVVIGKKRSLRDRLFETNHSLLDRLVMEDQFSSWGGKPYRADLWRLFEAVEPSAEAAELERLKRERSRRERENYYATGRKTLPKELTDAELSAVRAFVD